ncbi:MAG TPA: hypothetical protein PLD23_15825 [Armatimonadota bacterium]|nr:hypothetical protein [Armatimonadota bacterium]
MVFSLAMGVVHLAVAAVPPTVGRPVWEAQWVWGAAEPHGPLGLFRKTFDVDGELVLAIIQCSGDDGFTLYVDGDEVFGGGFWWNTTNTVDVTARLSPGRHVVAARVQNAAHPGGLLVQATLVYGDGRRVTLASDDTWRFSAEETPGWLDPGFDDSGWEHCRAYGSPPVGPWHELPLAAVGPVVPGRIVELRCPGQVRAGEDLPVSFAVELSEPTKANHLGYVRLLRDGRVVAEAEDLAPHRPTSGLTAGTAAQVGPAPLRIPRFAWPGDYTVEAGLYGVTLHDAATATRQLHVEARPGAGRVTRAEVRDHRGAPALFLDGKPAYPMWFFSWAPQPVDVLAFEKAGVNVHTFGVPLGWSGPGRYDHSDVDRLMLQLLGASDQAYAVPRVQMDAPDWWLDAHEDELTRYASGVGWESNGWGGTKHPSFASLVWRREAGEALRQLVEHILASPYSDRVIGIHVASGIYGEWHYWSATDFPDVSEPMRQKLIRDMRARYGTPEAWSRAWGQPVAPFETATIPSVEERQNGDVGMFRDPGRSRKVMDYYDTLFGAQIDAIEDFCRVVKEASDDRLLTLVFCGYLPDLEWTQEGDHRLFIRALRSPVIDAFSSPHSYHRRGLGADGYFRNFPASVRLHGKLFVDEGDDRTYRANDPTFTAVTNTEESLQLIRREFGNAIANDVGLWYMDQQGDWFHDDAIMDEIGLLKRWADRALRRPKQRHSEVGVFYSMATEPYLAGRTSGRNRVSAPMTNAQLGELCKAGAPFDFYVMDDLTDDRLPEYRVYVMLDAQYLTPAQRATVVRLRNEGASFVWIHAPGFITEDGLSIEAACEIAGMRLRMLTSGTCQVMAADGTTLGPGGYQAPLFAIDDPGAEVLGTLTGTELPGLAVRAAGRSLSLFSSVPGVPARVLREFWARAGVHIYLDTDDPIQVGSDWITIVAATAGAKTIRLPRAKPVLDIAAGRRIARRTAEFTVDMAAGETRIYYLGPETR